MKAIVLFAHGARDPEWARPILFIRDAVRRQTSAKVEVAFLEFIAPSLSVVVDELVIDGCRELVVVPLFMAQSGHTRRDLPSLLAAVRHRHPHLKLRVAPPIGEAPEVAAAIAAFAVRQ